VEENKWGKCNKKYIYIEANKKSEMAEEDYTIQDMVRKKYYRSISESFEYS
jgi:hypothetical protein